MSAKKDLYEVLGLSKNASQEEIKSAYTKLAKQHHPDRKGGSEEKFKEINEAYETLKDPSKRQQYDMFGQNMNGSGFDNSQGFGFENFQQGGFDSSFFQNIFNFGSDGFSSFFTQQDNSSPIRGRDLQMNDTITLEELFYGKQINVEFETYVHCDPCKASGFTGQSSCTHCKGKGFVENSFDLFYSKTACRYCNQTGQMKKNACKTCNGEGRIRKKVKYLLKVPRGFDISKPIEYTGLGEAGVRGGKRQDIDGSLILKLAVEKHPIFTKINNDLHMDYWIDLHSALLGTTLEIIGIDGQNKLVTVPPIAENTTITVEDNGMWLSSKSSRRGNLVINIKIKLPKIVKDTSKIKFKDFWQSI